MTHAQLNADPAEIAKFEALAQRWWDPKGEFRPLHELNPLRLGFIEQRTPLAGRSVVDVGCGGGILAESMAALGAKVLGIDLAAAALQVAELHAELHTMESAVDRTIALEYRLSSAEELARTSPAAFDVATCMEMLEHVPEPAETVAALAGLVKPGGDVYVSTINRNLKAFLLAIVGAEYVMRLLPKGTHEYERFIRPSELDGWARAAGLELRGIAGMSYDALSKQFRLSGDASVNYLVHFRRAALS